MKRLLLSIFLLFVTFFNVKSQDLMNLRPTGFVNDYEQIFSVDQKQELEIILSDYAKTTTAEICIVSSEDFPAGDHIAATNLFNKWGIGSKELKNGLLIILSKTQRKYSIVPGYGLEEFLPDATLNTFTPDMKNYFRAGDYYGGVKGLIFDIKKELGDQGLKFLSKQKQIKKEKRNQDIKDILSTLLCIFFFVIVLGGVLYIIFIQYQKNKKFLNLKKEIQIILNNIEDLKKQLGDKIDGDVKKYVIDNNINLTNKLVTEETKYKIQLIYNKLLENKQVVNSVDAAVVIISRSKSDIQKYLNDNYPYCEVYLKEQLNNIITDTQIELQSPEFYTKKMANKLTGVQSLLDGKLRSFLALTVKINNIVSDYNNLENKNSELKKLYSEYVRKKSILSSVNIGKKYNDLVKFEITEFNNFLDKIKNYITLSMSDLKSGNLNSAISNYGSFITSSIVITSSFSSVDNLFNDYNNSEKYIKDNQNKPDSLKSSIDFKINKSGVHYSRKITYESIKSDLIRYKSNFSSDIILAASVLKTCINNLETLLSNIESDIYSEEAADKRKAAAVAAAAAAASYRSNDSSSYSSSSNSGFGGFSGGDSGGGGVSGSW
jgi:uncharacterized protein